MTGRIIAVFILVTAVLAGAGMYYLQVYAFYEDVVDAPDLIRLTPLDAGAPVPVATTGLTGIDADSSPLRFRACFALSDPADLSDRFAAYPNPEPLTAPGWFDCFDAAAIGADLRAGVATAYLAQANFDYGVDRVVAVYDDGRAFAWHQLNNCGQRRYDGTDVGPACPARD